MTTTGLDNGMFLTGGLNGGHRQAYAQAQSNSLNGAYNAYLGTSTAGTLYSRLAARAAFIAAAGPVFAASPPIEDAGIKAGEIIAWRCWKIKYDWLTSMAVESVWVPGQAMNGDIERAGIHAWKDYGRAIEYGLEYGGKSIVVGRIKLWGEVIEHEHGYRAEYGKIISIEREIVRGWFTQRKIKKIRMKYGVHVPGHGLT